jgi:GNAT superfamily N-acetyltransferase
VATDDDGTLFTCGDARVRLRRAAIDEILHLRHAELRAGLPIESASFDGDHDASTRHFGAFVVDAGGAGGRSGGAEAVVGCASFMVRPYEGNPAYQLRGMATRADLARRGIGGTLLRVAITELRARDGATLFWCNARVPAVPFYARMGWRVVSDVFDVPTAGPHRVTVYG